MLNFPCLILKVNSCLFSSFPFDNPQFHPQMGTLNTIPGLFPWKGHSRIPVGCHIAWVMKWCCWCGLGTTGGQLGCSVSQSTEDPASLSGMPCSSKWKIIFHLLPHNHYVCVLSYSDSLRPMDCSPPGSSVHGIFQVRILEWVAISFSRGLSRPRDQICASGISCIGMWILYHCATWEAPKFWDIQVYFSATIGTHRLWRVAL